jgi:O-antigen/teichoic acid export membrane protein
LALGVPLWVWRDWGWKTVLKTPVDWLWLVRGIKRGAFIWFGTLGAMLGSYVDRYFVNHFLSIEYVGVMTFYYSFANAFQPLVESGVLAFVAPRMVAYHKAGDKVGFWREVKQAGWQVGIGVGLLVLVLGVVVPALGHLLGKQAFVNEAYTLWLLLGGSWIHTMALVLYYILFAQHQDKPIWLGNILLMAPVLFCNILLIPAFGFEGVGYSAVATGVFLFFWRFKFIEWPRPLLCKKSA